MLKKIIVFLGVMAIAAPPVYAEEDTWLNRAGSKFGSDLKQDVGNYLSEDNLIKLGGAFVVAGTFANTGLDRSVRKLWLTNIKSNKSDNFFYIPEQIGAMCWIALPLYLGSMIIGNAAEEYRFGEPLFEWGYRSARTFLIGGVQQGVFTALLGAGRPIEGVGSNWQPFRHRTAVSGHTFYGAVPFLTAAHMTDPWPLRTLLYVASTLPGLSRINSDAHYTSQVILGWSIAYLTSCAVYQTEENRKYKREDSIQLVAFPYKDGGMLFAKLRY